MLAEYYSKKELKEIDILLKNYEEPNVMVYEMIGLLSQNTDSKQLLEDLRNNKKIWEFSHFEEIRNKREMRDKFIESPPEIKESDYPCPKCKTLKTILLEIQTRSCDEGFTYELHCFNKDCGFVKRMNNF